MSHDSLAALVLCIVDKTYTAERCAHCRFHARIYRRWPNLVSQKNGQWSVLYNCCPWCMVPTRCIRSPYMEVNLPLDVKICIYIFVYRVFRKKLCLNVSE